MSGEEDIYKAFGLPDDIIDLIHQLDAIEAPAREQAKQDREDFMRYLLKLKADHEKKLAEELGL